MQPLSRFAFWSLSLASAILVIASPSAMPAQRDATVHTLVSLDLRNVALETVVQEITRQSGVIVSYSKDRVPVDTRVSVKVSNVPAVEALRYAVAGTGVMVSTTAGGQVILSQAVSGTIANASALVANGAIRGRVTDARTGEPLANADLQISGLRVTAHTNAEGRYVFTSVPSGTYTITARRLGYAHQNASVTVRDGETTTADIKMSVAVNALEQVVVSGTVVPTAEKAIPNPITIITAKDIEEHGITRLPDLFRGYVPGVAAQDLGPFAEQTGTSLYVRGGSSFSTLASGISANAIKTYIDGIEVSDPTYINNIDPNIIERIEILRGPQASTIYGSGAINGVMQIFTKKGARGERPRLTLSLAGGRVESNDRTPGSYQYNHSATVDGSSQRMSYAGTLSYSIIGPWTPGYLTRTFGGSTGLQMEYGPVRASASLRLSQRLFRIGQAGTNHTRELVTGEYTYSSFDVAPLMQNYTRTQQTLGTTVDYNPTSWWQNSLTVGQDQNKLDNVDRRPRYRTPTDTLIGVSSASSPKTTYNYNTSLRIQPNALWSITTTAGLDGWRSTTTSVSTNTTSATGTLGGSPTVTRNLDRNTGYFLQTQIGFADRVFLTAGGRAEDNPNFGDDVGLVYTGRLGASALVDYSAVTIKPRMSWGRATRPPTQTQKNGSIGSTNITLPNPDLVPEQQVGLDYGFDLYVGNRYTLKVTRYDQMVNNLILIYQLGMPPEYDVTTYMYQNIGRIQSRGWELEGSARVGPVTLRGSHSAMDPRIRQVNSNYIGSYKVGDKYRTIPNVTSGLSATYTIRRGSVTLDANRVGASISTDNATADLSSKRRLMPVSATARLATFPAFTRYNLNGAYDVFKHVAATVSITNLFNDTTNDWTNNTDVMGRRSLFGVRMRW